MDANNPDFLALLEELAASGQLDAMFQPFGQEQDVLGQEMAIASALRRHGPQRTTPTGALLGGMSDALGSTGSSILQQRNLEAQRSLGGRMQQDATGRMQALINLLRQQQPAPTPDLTPADLLE